LPKYNKNIKKGLFCLTDTSLYILYTLVTLLKDGMSAESHTLELDIEEINWV